MKQHDFLATLVKNPDLTIDDLKDNNITPENSSFLSKSEYKNNPNVIEAFKDETGKFDENKFNTYYDNARILYANYANDELVRNIDKNFTYGPDAWFAPEDAVYRNDNPVIFLNKIPRNNSQGISYITEEYDSGANLSIRELAQREKVFDYDSGNFLDWSPNDKAGLFKPIGLPTLVLAQWDEDGTHIENGIEVQHRAGDIKLNNNGRPYYETLSGRDIYNKDVLRNSDILTVDGSKWNKLDFLDSDDIKKSIPKTIVSVIAKVAPMFIPGVGEIYGYFGAADGLIRVAPVLLKSVNGIIAGGNDNPQGRALSKWEAYVSRYDQTASDWGREHMASVEGLGNLVTDISRQLFEQRAVSTIPVLFKQLRGTKNIEAALEGSKTLAKNSQRLALAYMAATSAQDVYSDFKQAGATDAVAGLGMLASTLALYRLMNIDYFRDNILKDTFMDESEVRRALRGTIKDTAKHFVPTAQTATKKEAATFLKKASDFYHDKLLDGLQKKGVAGLVSRGLSEGTEEVMEEVTTDLIKGVTEGLNAIGIPVTKQDRDLDFGWSLKDFATRYGTSFVGGFLGGMIFAGQSRYEQWLNRKRYNLDKINPDDLKRLTYYIANGKRGEIDEYLERWYNKGVLGSKDLSIDGETMFTLDGKSQFIPSTEGISQNEAVYRTVKYTLDVLQDAIESEVPDIRYLTEEGINELRNLGYTDREVLGNSRLITASAISALGDYSSFQNDLYDVLRDIVAKKSELAREVDSLSKTKPASEEERKSQAEDIKNNKRIQELQEELKELRKKKDAFFNGSKNKYYAGQALFAANQGLQKSFVDVSKDTYVKIKYGLSYDSFNDEQKKKIDVDYEEYRSGDGRKNIYRAFDLYLGLSTKIAPILQKHGEDLDKALREKREPIAGMSKYFDAKEEYDHLRQEYSELEKIDPSELTEDQKTRMTELKVSIDALKEETLSLEKNPAISLITSDPILTEFFRTTDTTKKAHVYDDLNTQKEGEAITSNILNILRNIYQHATTSGEYRFDDAELQALLHGIATSYKTDGGAEARWDAYQRDFRDDIYFNGGLEIDQDIIDAVSIDSADPVLFKDTGDFKESVIRTVDNLINNLGTNNAAVIKSYNELLELLKAQTKLLEPGNEEYLNDFLSYIIPTIDGESIIDIIKEFDGYRENIKYSAFLELASQLGTDVKDLDLLSLVVKESLNLSTQPNLTDYMIKNESVKRSLHGDSIKALLEMTTALIQGASDGTNDIMNNFKDRSTEGTDESIPKLATLSDRAAQELKNQAKDLTDRIGFLYGLSELNSSRSLLKHKNTAINMRPKWIKALLTLKDSIQDAFGFDIEQLWKETTDDFPIDKVDSLNYSDFEKAAIKFENAIYDQVGLSPTNETQLEEVAEKLLSIINAKKAFIPNSTKISDSEEETIRELDLVYYFANIISLKSEDFYKAYLAVSDPQIAPVYGQEYVTKQLISQIINPALFNKILSKAKSKADYSDLSQKEKNYYEAKSVLYNLGVVLGGAGSGKTVAVIKKVLEVLNNSSDSVEIKFVAKQQTQANKVAKSGGYDDNAAFTVDKYLQSIGVVIDKYTFDRGTDHFKIDVNKSEEESIWDENSKLKVLVIDEIETLTEGELEQIANDALLGNVFVLGLGDLKQPGTDIKTTNDETDNTVHSSSIEDCLFVSTPVLTTSMRAQSVAQFENANRLGHMLDLALKHDHIDDRAKAIGESSTELYYYEDPESGSVVGAMPVTTQEQLDTKLQQLSKLVENTDDDIIIIAEDDQVGKYSKYETKKVKIVPYSQRAGVEASYVIVDVDFAKHNSRANALNNFLVARDIYTLTQRASKGTVLLVKDNVGPFKFTSDKTKAAIITLDTASIEEFTRWRNEALSNIDPNEKALQESLEKSPLVTKSFDSEDRSDESLTDSESKPTVPDSPTPTPPTSPSSTSDVSTPSADEVINEEPETPGGIINPTEESPVPVEEEKPKPVIAPTPETSVDETNLRDRIIGLSDNKINTSRELIIGLSEVFPASKDEILKILDIAKGELSDVLHNEAVLRSLNDAIRSKYGNKGLDILNIILRNLNNLPISAAISLDDDIKRLVPTGIVSTGSSIDEETIPLSYISGRVSDFSKLISSEEFEKWSLETRKDALGYKDIRTVFGSQGKTLSKFAKDSIIKVSSYERTGYFGSQNGKKDISELIAKGIYSKYFRKFVGGNTELWIVPYKESGVGLLISRHYSTVDNDYFDIPILMVKTNKFGKYNGNILRSQKCKLWRSGNRVTLDELRANGIYFTNFAGVPRKISYEPTEPTDIDGKTKQYLDQNNGKPLIAYTDEVAIKEMLMDIPGSIYRTSNGKSITGYELISLMGIQCRCTFNQLLDLIHQYEQYEHLDSTSKPVLFKNAADPTGEVSEEVESEVLNNGSLIYNSKGEIKQILPRERGGQLLTLACLTSKSSRWKLAGLLNYQDNNPYYKTTYVLEIGISQYDRTTGNTNTIHSYTVGYINGKYVVGKYNTATGEFKPLDDLDISVDGNIDNIENNFLKQILTKLQKIHGTDVVPYINLRYHSFGLRGKNKGNNYTKQVTTNWELHEFVAGIPQGEELERFAYYLSEHPQFKYGIYLNDNTVKDDNAIPGSYYLKLDTSGRVYDTDLTELDGSTYVIDTDQIEVVSENAPIVVKQTLDDFIAKNHLGIKASSLEEANRLLMNNSNDWSYQQIIETDAGYELQTIDTTTDIQAFINLIKSKYNIDLDENNAQNILDTRPGASKYRFDIGPTYVAYVDNTGKLFIINAEQWSSDIINAASDVYNSTNINEGIKVEELVSSYLANKFFGLHYDEKAFAEYMSNNEELTEAVWKLEEVWPC